MPEGSRCLWGIALIIGLVAGHHVLPFLMSSVTAVSLSVGHVHLSGDWVSGVANIGPSKSVTCYRAGVKRGKGWRGSSGTQTAEIRMMYRFAKSDTRGRV